MTLFLKRAALIAALSLFSLSALSQDKNSKSETYKDLIEKAYNLSLQKDRQQALNILTSALQKERRAPAVAELKRTIDEIAHVFFSDKAQQLFESSVSLRKLDLPQATQKMSEASRIEPDNLTIVNELARLQIAKGECKTALETLLTQKKLFPLSEELRLSRAQALACDDKWVEFQKSFDPSGVKKSSLQKFWLALEVERHFEAKSYAKMQDTLAILKKLDDKYPEVFYWLWKHDHEQKKPNQEFAQKYVMTCKNISANQHRQYMIDPMLCRRVAEVEAELKGMNGTPE